MSLSLQKMNLFEGVALYSHQAAQSLDRALLSDLSEFRLFYLERDASKILAIAVLDLQKSIDEINGNIFQRTISFHPFRQIDLWLMSRLLWDFSSIIEGGSYSPQNLGCLRYCLTMISSRFMRKCRPETKKTFGKLNWYNRNEILSAGLEIQDVLGADWMGR